MASCHGPSLDERRSNLESEYGFLIRFDPVDDLVPLAWRNPPFSAEYLPVERRELARFLVVLEDALSPYPKELLKSSLSEIRVFRMLSLLGVQYGGTFLNDILFITVDTEQQGYSDERIGGLVHHEISSVLFQRYGFDFEDWQRVGQNQISYDKSATERLESIRNKTEFVGSRSLYERGLLAEYAVASAEDDANLYAEMIFSEPDRMQQLIRDHELVLRKYELVKQFYLRVDAGFAPTFGAIDRNE